VPGWSGALGGVLDVAVFGVVLNEPRIRALVGEREAASVAEHVRVGAARFLGYQDRALFFFYSAAWDRFSERVHQGYFKSDLY